MDNFKWVFENVTKQRMAEMWCELNTYKIPPEFNDTLPNNKYETLIVPMKEIQDEIGKEACLKEWNVRHKTKTHPL